MSISKQFLKSKPVCKVSFKLETEAAIASNEAFIVGDFNNWDKTASPMKKLKKEKTFSLILELETGKEYQFRYLLDNEVWQNEPEADKQVPSGFAGSENSVVSTIE